MVILGVGVARVSGALTVGEPAPDFALPDHTGRLVRLSDFRGKQHVVLAFYIQAFTPG
jgi:peroxiredoxin